MFQKQMGLRVLGGITAACLLLSGCSAQPSDRSSTAASNTSDVITVSFKNNQNWSQVEATLSSTESEQTQTISLVDSYTSEDNTQVYPINVDLSQYDRISFSDGDTHQSVCAPVTRANEGYEMFDDYRLSFFNDADDPAGTLEQFTLPYGDGTDRQITVFLPPGYSADNTDPYPTIYMMDGQSLFDPSSTDHGDWSVDETVTAEVKNGLRGQVIVAIDNGDDRRDSELTPNLGQTVPEYEEYNGGTGQAFSDFVVSTLMPYMNEHYNVSDNREDTVIAGSSSGGIEAFYIGMEHMDLFGGIAALSPAFMLYDDATWQAYFSSIDFSNPDMLPKLYIYNGEGQESPQEAYDEIGAQLEQELYDGAAAMVDRLAALGYPQEKVKFTVLPEGIHNEGYWRIFFPEAISFLYDI